jgi:hypothetical protein
MLSPSQNRLQILDKKRKFSPGFVTNNTKPARRLLGGTGGSQLLTAVIDPVLTE